MEKVISTVVGKRKFCVVTSLEVEDAWNVLVSMGKAWYQLAFHYGKQPAPKWCCRGNGQIG